MAHHHDGDIQQTLALCFAAMLPIVTLALIVGASWEAHRRKHGRTPKPGSSHEAVTARFSPATE
jgi:hypothetical protein